MATIVNQRPGLGASFGTGINSGVSQLLDAKIKQLIEAPHQQKIADLLASINPQNQSAPQQQPGFAEATPGAPGIQQQEPSYTEAPAVGQQQQQPAQGKLTRPQLYKILPLLPPAGQKIVLDAFDKQEAADLNQAKFDETKQYHKDTLDLKKQAQIEKRVGPELSNIRRAAHTARKEIPQMKQVLYLLENGKPITGQPLAFLRKLGVEDLIGNPTNQVLRQMNEQLSQGAGSAYEVGGNLTNQEVTSYKNHMLSLPAGLKANIVRFKNFILERETAEALDKAYTDILKENGGKLTDDMVERIRDRTQEVADKNFNAAMENLREFVEGKSGKKKSTNAIGEESIDTQERTPFQQKTDEIERHVLRTGARVGESLLGLPGDIASLGLGAANYLSSGAIPNYEQIQENLPVSLPTSQQNREFLKEKTGGYLEPQGKLEEFADEVASDLSTLLLPVKGKIPFKSAIARALGSNAAAYFTKELGGGPLAQAGAKIGVSLLAGLPGIRGKMETTMNQGYDQARKSAAKGTANTSALSSKARKIYDAASRGDSPNKDFIKERARAVERIADTGKASIADITTLKQDLNRQLRENAADLSKNDKRIIGTLLEDVRGILDKYGKTNITFGQNFNQAEDIYKGLNTQSYVSEVLDKYLSPTNIKNPYVKAVLYGAGAFHSPLTAIKIAGASYGSQQIAKTFDLFKNSKEAQKYYREFLTQALKNNGPAAARAAVKLDEAAQDYSD